MTALPIHSIPFIWTRLYKCVAIIFPNDRNFTPAQAALHRALTGSSMMITAFQDHALKACGDTAGVNIRTSMRDEDRLVFVAVRDAASRNLHVSLTLVAEEAGKVGDVAGGAKINGANLNTQAEQLQREGAVSGSPRTVNTFDLDAAVSFRPHDDGKLMAVIEVFAPGGGQVRVYNRYMYSQGLDGLWDATLRVLAEENVKPERVGMEFPEFEGDSAPLAARLRAFAARASWKLVHWVRNRKGGIIAATEPPLPGQEAKPFTPKVAEPAPARVSCVQGKGWDQNIYTDQVIAKCNAPRSVNFYVHEVLEMRQTGVVSRFDAQSIGLEPRLFERASDFHSLGIKLLRRVQAEGHGNAVRLHWPTAHLVATFEPIVPRETNAPSPPRKCDSEALAHLSYDEVQALAAKGVLL